MSTGICFVPFCFGGLLGLVLYSCSLPHSWRKVSFVLFAMHDRIGHQTCDLQAPIITKRVSKPVQEHKSAEMRHCDKHFLCIRGAHSVRTNT